MLAKIVCMYCKSVIRTEEWPADDVHEVVESHGICRGCTFLHHPKIYRRMQARIRRGKRRDALIAGGMLNS